jgi:hypothetical protein
MPSEGITLVKPMFVPDAPIAGTGDLDTLLGA